MIFTQHMPPMVSGIKPFKFKFNTLTALLSHKWIKGWQDKAGFYRYSMTADNSLMVEFRNGYEWWCLGHIKGGNIQSLDLPTIEYKKELKRVMVVGLQRDNLLRRLKELEPDELIQKDILLKILNEGRLI